MFGRQTGALLSISLRTRVNLVPVGELSVGILFCCVYMNICCRIACVRKFMGLGGSPRRRVGSLSDTVSKIPANSSMIAGYGKVATGERVPSASISRLFCLQTSEFCKAANKYSRCTVKHEFNFSSNTRDVIKFEKASRA